MYLIFVYSCASTQATNVAHDISVNINISDLIVGEKINIKGKFSNSEIQSGYALSVLTAKALKGTDYDFILMPRIETSGSTVTLMGRPARLK